MPLPSLQVIFGATSIPRTKATTFAGLVLFLALLVVLSPLIVMARRMSLRLELFILIGLSAAWIATTGVVSALAIAAFLALGFFLVRLELRCRDANFDPIAGHRIFRAGLILFQGSRALRIGRFRQTSSMALPLGLSHFGIRTRTVTAIPNRSRERVRLAQL
jgi:hypothetical protein